MPARKIPRAKSRRRPGSSSSKARARPERSLAAVVGPQVYATWVDMLRTLVPYGRTHRLSVVIAGMLQHAASVACRATRGEPPQGSVAASLLLASEEADPEEIGNELDDVIRRLFRDAKVHAERTNVRGNRYSIIDSAIQEFVTWENMPWE